MRTKSEITKDGKVIRVKDLMGMRFERLVVIEEMAKDSRSNRIYKCLCDCGNTKDVLAISLTNGLTRSCGCLLKESATRNGKGNALDIVGKKFNRLTVIANVETKKQVSYVLCKCDCGNEVEVRASLVNKGRTKSCGCLSKDMAKDLGAKRAIDLTGQRFGKLTATKYLGNSKWECVCDCGEIKSFYTKNLRRGSTKSCGCIVSGEEKVIGKRNGMLEVVGKHRDTDNHKYGYDVKCDCGNVIVMQKNSILRANKKHCGCVSAKKKELLKIRVAEKKVYTELVAKNKKLYGVRGGMKARCYNSNDKDYYNYGGRGIKVCDEWNDSFESFCKWALDNGYEEGLSIDRIDNDGNYEPANCRWVTNKFQQNNKQKTAWITINGITKSMKEWSELTGKSYMVMKKSRREGKHTDEEIVFGKKDTKLKMDKFIEDNPHIFFDTVSLDKQQI